MTSVGGMIPMVVAALATTTAVAATAPKNGFPQRREAVVDLSYVLGEMHAIHRVCAGPDDDTWRSKMARLMEIETPDAAYRQRLTLRFNSGFVDGSAAYPTCAPATQSAERRVAEEGRALARRLARPAAF